MALLWYLYELGAKTVTKDSDGELNVWSVSPLALQKAQSPYKDYTFNIRWPWTGTNLVNIIHPSGLNLLPHLDAGEMVDLEETMKAYPDEA